MGQSGSATPSPAAISDNASPTTNSIDTKGWDYLEVYVVFGAMDIAMAALKLQSSDTDGSYADVTGLVSGTSLNIAGETSTLPIDTRDNTIYGLQVDLRGQKRYFDLVITTGNGDAGTYVMAIARLSRGKDMPTTAAEMGLLECLRV